MSRCILKHRALGAAVALVLGLSLAACGGDRGDGGADPDQTPVAAPGPAVEATPEAAPPEPLSEKMPTAGLEPDGRTASWAVAVQIGATLHALTAACGQHASAELERMHDEQRDAMSGEGVDPARFDAVWSWAYRHAEEKIEAQSPEDLAKGCARLIEMEEEARRMGEMMRHMALPAS